MIELVKEWVEQELADYQKVYTITRRMSFLRELQSKIDEWENPQEEDKPTEPLKYKKYEEAERDFAAQGKSTIGYEFNAEMQRHAKYIPDFFE